MALALLSADGNYFLRKDHICGMLLLDPASHPYWESESAPELPGNKSSRFCAVEDTRYTEKTDLMDKGEAGALGPQKAVAGGRSTVNHAGLMRFSPSAALVYNPAFGSTAALAYNKTSDPDALPTEAGTWPGAKAGSRAGAERD